MKTPSTEKLSLGRLRKNENSEHYLRFVSQLLKTIASLAFFISVLSNCEKKEIQRPNGIPQGREIGQQRFIFV